MTKPKLNFNKLNINPKMVVGCVPKDDFPVWPPPEDVLRRAPNERDITYTTSTCDTCGREVWLGSNCAPMVGPDVPKMCFYCLAEAGVRPEHCVVSSQLSKDN